MNERTGFPTRWLAPALGLIALAWAVPVVYTFALAFTNASIGTNGSFVGLSNFAAALGDARFGHALVVSAVFAFGSVVLNVGAGLGIAWVVFRSRRSRAFLQTVLLLPWALSEIAVAMVWHEFLAQDGGLINLVTVKLGLGAVAWKTSTVGAMSALWLASLWHGLAFSALLQMAGLASLQPELIQAARLEGASRGLILRRIILPHQRGALVANSLLVGLSSLVAFSLPFALTGGGPLFATELVSLYTFRVAFGGEYRLGYAAALGLLVLALYAGPAFFYLKRRRAV
jgi:multiple sugar transport system permease protein